jgi:hypothetical protein
MSNLVVRVEGQGKQMLTRKASPWWRGPARGRWRQLRCSEVDNDAGEDVEVRAAGAELVVVKSRVNGGRRWRPVCRQFPDSKGDGGLADSGSQISSRWPSGAGSQNEGSGIEGVSEQRQTAKEMMVKGSRRRQRARETKFCEVISGEKVGPNV